MSFTLICKDNSNSAAIFFFLKWRLPITEISLFQRIKSTGVYKKWKTNAINNHDSHKKFLCIKKIP